MTADLEENYSQSDSTSTKEPLDFLNGFYDGLLNEENKESSQQYKRGFYQGRSYLLRRVNSASLGSMLVN
jgi:hypothetical protein